MTHLKVKRRIVFKQLKNSENFNRKSVGEISVFSACKITEG